MKQIIRTSGFILPLITMLWLAGCSKENILLQEEKSGVEGAAATNATSGQTAEDSRFVDGAYIVVFKDDVTDIETEVNTIGRSLGVRPDFIYRHAVKGFAAKLPAAALNGLKNNPRIKYIEQDQYAKTVTTQSPATWGLDRIDQAFRPLSGSYTYTTTGASVDAYIFDTGIWFTHDEFGGRARLGYDAYGGTGNDDNGHGTHVAGTVGGRTYGIAKEITLYAIKVLSSSGSGTYSGIIAGLDWAVNHHATKPAVGNMSLGGGASATLDDAVRRCIADGIVMCVAAGNSTADAINYSPARVSEAITVGATSSSDGFASFSNYGPVVDILAPGVSITSAWFGSNTVTNTISGTSMASPHTAGISAIYLEAFPGSLPAAVATGLKTSATPNLVSSVPAGTANLLLYAAFSAPPATIPSAPTLSAPGNGSSLFANATTLSWNTATGATTYRVQVSTTSDFSSILFDHAGLAPTSIPVSNLTYGTTYYWRVNATNSVGTSVWSGAWSFVTIDPNQLATPVLISPANGATGIGTNIKLTWNRTANAAAYQLQVSLAADFSTLVLNKTGITGTSMTVSKLKAKTQYYWRLRATNTTGTVTSAWAGRSFTTR